MFSTWTKFLVLSVTLSFVLSQSQDLISLSLSSTSLTLIKGETGTIDIKVETPLPRNVSITFTESNEGKINWTPKTLNIPSNTRATYVATIIAQNPGKIEIEGDATPVDVINDLELFFRIIVANNRFLIIFSVIVGWIYFAAWSISFYPQLILNYRRKSVVGLSFDFLALNIVGHSMYAIFNFCLYFSTYFQDEYFVRFPHGMNPVELNDVFFSGHAVILTLITIGQCFYYESGTQRVSKIAWGINGIFSVVVLVMIIICGIGALHWLDFLYALSYIKLAVTLTKYVPQAVYNYRRKSTIGWSIENILLDFTGGILSMAQMMFNSYNYDDWAQIFGDPTKFYLGLFSVIFDIVFMLQHYVFYRHNREDPAREPKTEVSEDTETKIETGLDEKVEKF